MGLLPGPTPNLREDGMGAVRHCAHCGSGNTESELDTKFCFDCGGHTDALGNALPRPPQFVVPSFQERKQRGEVQ